MSKPDIAGRFHRRSTSCLLGGCGLVAACVSIPVHAAELFYRDNLSIRLDTSLRYNLGVRIEGRDARIADNPSSDEGDWRFDRGEIITNRLDILSEFELDWRNTLGVRVSAAGWYDAAYDGRVRQNPRLAALDSSYTDNRYSAVTRRYYLGPSGEFLDAFAYANLNLGGRAVSIKAGRHIVYWGNAALTQGGISYSQGPVDGRKGAANPGTEARELFLPQNQLSLTAQITPMISIGAQYYFEWDHVRSPEGGTFLAGSDLTLDGPDRAGGGLPFIRGAALGPERERGDWGLSVRATLPSNGWTIGAYYRDFTERNGLWLLRNPLNPLEYRAVFPRNTTLIGLSLDSTMGPLAVGAELSQRKDAGLASVGFSLADEGARGDTWHALVNIVYGVPQTRWWSSGTLLMEMTYDALDKLTRNQALFNRAGSAACPLGKYAGCATGEAWGLGMNFTPTWTQALKGVDISIPVTIQTGLKGNTPDFGGTSQGAVSYSLGVQFDVKRQWLLSLTYADVNAKIRPTGTTGPLGPLYTGNGGWLTSDRGRIVFTAKASF